MLMMTALMEQCSVVSSFGKRYIVGGKVAEVDGAMDKIGVSSTTHRTWMVITDSRVIGKVLVVVV